MDWNRKEKRKQTLYFTITHEMIMLIVCILSYSLGRKFAHGKFRVRKSCPKVALAAAERACLQLISSL